MVPTYIFSSPGTPPSGLHEVYNPLVSQSLALVPKDFIPDSFPHQLAISYLSRNFSPDLQSYSAWPGLRLEAPLSSSPLARHPLWRNYAWPLSETVHGAADTKEPTTLLRKWTTNRHLDVLAILSEVPPRALSLMFVSTFKLPFKLYCFDILRSQKVKIRLLLKWHTNLSHLFPCLPLFLQKLTSHNNCASSHHPLLKPCILIG